METHNMFWKRLESFHPVLEKVDETLIEDLVNQLAERLLLEYMKVILTRYIWFYHCLYMLQYMYQVWL